MCAAVDWIVDICDEEIEEVTVLVTLATTTADEVDRSEYEVLIGSVDRTMVGGPMTLTVALTLVLSSSMKMLGT